MGGLTTHILDTASGTPAEKVPIKLFRLTKSASDDDTHNAATTKTLLKSMHSNADGRTDSPLLSGDEFSLGTYELEFSVAQYFAAQGTIQTDPAFLDDITLRFTMTEASHYHVPLLVSPWSYSTYRGS